jgi:RHS repeat-associated protein
MPGQPERENVPANQQGSLPRPPSISLPKGGGAIRGIGEKFAANPVTGTGSLSVPIATSPGRSGFGPQLSLTYDSGAGNGPFGFGWSLSLPAIARKTDKGLPRYRDAIESDVFILAGAEDLVPALAPEADGTWQPEIVEPRTVDAVTYAIRRYRPRIEGMFARIERWTNAADPVDTFWRSITKENVTTWYGRTGDSRIVDPADDTRVFSWLICESHDDKGNVIAYRYRREDAKGIDLSQAHERHRGPATDPSRLANRYLDRIQYGNHTPYSPRLASDARWPSLPADGSWFFEAVFDYGDHDSQVPLPVEPGRTWPVRADPFSSYRAGFEVRTYRLCQRVLMFHHFPGEPGVGDNCLVRSTDFTYAHEPSPTNARSPIYSFLQSVSHHGYKRSGNEYLSRQLPPVDFAYSTVPTAEDLADQPVRELEVDSLENLPYGLDSTQYQWADLDGEGLAGILTEQGAGWFYKRNLSPLEGRKTAAGEALAQFGPAERLTEQPSLATANARSRLLDLAGDGQLDVVDLEGPVPGFFERSRDGSWVTFKAFESVPVLDWDDPNLTFVDLTGDGHADILITEDEVFSWHPSLGEAGFGAQQKVPAASDEDKGPRLVLADKAQSVYLADLSGDGLTDLVRIRNGDVCYWPNLGYGRFGPRITMDNAPVFDAPDLFDQRRIRLADTDGSGATDILYLRHDRVDLYFNQSGNSWSEPVTLAQFARIDNAAAVTALDLLGNGTACLVWSSPLPGERRRPMRYIDLMGGQKPHLLVGIANNLGAETRITYAPSTKFYLADKIAGKPWISRLPFPVHVVEKVTVTDRWRKSAFTTTYSYHHGHFDGFEREFRGFGRVDSVDVESFGTFAAANPDSPYVTADRTLYQPPVKTVTWYHTGAADVEHAVTAYADEYFPRSFERLNPSQQDVTGDFEEHALPEPELSANLSAGERREALRACKGIMLRHEIYELDVDALERGEHRPAKLFSVAGRTCRIERLQPRAANRHAVFLALEEEAITDHYELDLTTTPVRSDPRVVHVFNLRHDKYGNVLQSVQVVYPRIAAFHEDGLADADQALIRALQREAHLSYTETRYTADFGERADEKEAAKDHHRLRVPCEVLTYELTGIAAGAAASSAGGTQQTTYVERGNLGKLWLSEVHQNQGEAVDAIAYHELPDTSTKQKRLVEHTRTLFFKDDPNAAGSLEEPLELGRIGRLGLPYERYTLAMTGALLDAVFSDGQENKLDAPVEGNVTARALLADASRTGYLSGADLTGRFATIPAAALAGQYWIRTGVAGFEPDAAAHFYLPERFQDPFGKITTVKYDERDLFVESSTDTMGNVTRVAKAPSNRLQFDYRVLAPREMEDINQNRAEVYFDALGLPVALALKGKGNEADTLDGLDDASANPSIGTLEDFFVTDAYDQADAQQWLRSATMRHVYYFGQREQLLPNGTRAIAWGRHPACACGIGREQHVAQLPANARSAVQTSFEYTDGIGSVIVKKVQAEPEGANQPLRWVASAKTILNNKGKPVKQYEPYFSVDQVGSPNHRFEESREEGVTPILYYDAVGRLIRTEFADGSLTRVEFSPWHVRTFDQNDTLIESRWFADRNPPTPNLPLPRNPLTGELTVTPDQRAAWLAAQHRDTSSLAILDSLGRDVGSIVHNRVTTAAGQTVNEKHFTFTRLDAEGKVLWIRDARRNLVMQYVRPTAPPNQSADPVAFAPAYDIAGALLFQHSMDGGDRWMLNDAAGQPLVTWTARGHVVVTTYDARRRPVRSTVRGANAGDPNGVIEFERTVYGDSGDASVPVPPEALNLRGRIYRHRDGAGVVTYDRFDFKGNLLAGSRRFVKDYSGSPDWSDDPVLEAETFSGRTAYDALNRPVQLVVPHSDRAATKLNVVQPRYNEAGLLEAADVWLEQAAAPAAVLDPASATYPIVSDIGYNAKGQRTLTVLGNGIRTEYEYDAASFRLARLRATRAGSVLQDLSYTYDASGNITAVRDDAQEEVFHSGACVRAGAEYCYDALYRLVGASGREHKGGDQQPEWEDGMRLVFTIPNDCQALQNYVERYRYDAAGNILQMVHHRGGAIDQPGPVIWNRQYQYATDSNRLLATRLPGDPTNLPDYAAAPGYGAKYTYDRHGSITSMPDLPVMAWDFRDQLQMTQRQLVANGGTGEKTYYVYDSRGERVRKVTELPNGARKDERLYLGGFEIYRRYDGGQAVALERETLHVMDDKQRVALIETRTVGQGNDPAPRQLVRYQLASHLGSSTLEVNELGKIISYEEYHPYGSTAYRAARNQTDTRKRYAFTGKERDEESGFTYHGARYYAPWLGRWATVDPAGLIDGPNVYWYGNDNPVRFRDTTGHVGEPNADSLALPDPPQRPGQTLLSPIVTDDFGLKEATKARAPGTLGASVFLGEVKQDPLTTLADDPAFRDVAKRVWGRMRSLDYENFRTNLNTEIRGILTGAEDHELKALLELRNGELYWKSGAFAGTRLNYAHIVSQQTVKNLKLDRGLMISLDNLAPVGGSPAPGVTAENFHLKTYGHKVDLQHGKGLTEEAKAGLRALRVERPPNAPALDIDWDLPRPRPGQEGGIDPHLLLSTKQSREILKKVVGGVLRHGPDVAVLALEGKDENASFATLFGILVGTLAFNALKTPTGALIGGGIVVTGAAWYAFFTWRFTVDWALREGYRNADPSKGGSWP